MSAKTFGGLRNILKNTLMKSKMELTFMLIAGTKYKSTMFAIQIIWLLPLYFYFDQIASIICQTVTLTPMGNLASGKKLQLTISPPPVNFIGSEQLLDAAQAES